MRICYTGGNDAPIRSSQEQPHPRLRRRQYATYAAGIEGSISQGVGSCDIRHARYAGLPKTRLQHLATASAINLLRVSDWLDETPRAQTRQSAFARLYRMAA